MLRYSLAAMLIAVVVVSVGCAAITHPTPLWSQIVFTGVVVLLLAATVAAVVGGPRPFAAGLAIFGWGYLLLTSGPWAASVRPHLLTETALARLEPLVVDASAANWQVWRNSPVLYGGYGGDFFDVDNNDGRWTTSSSLNINTVNYASLPYSLIAAGNGNPWLRQIGHSLWAILFGVAGGAAARLAAARKGKPPVSRPPENPAT
jgi:hypothetical protein